MGTSAGALRRVSCRRQKMRPPHQQQLDRCNELRLLSWAGVELLVPNYFAETVAGS